MNPTRAAQQQRFDAWLADHAAILHRVARAFASGAGRDDLMQELLLALWRAAPAFRGDATPATFIYRVAHNAALAWRRSENRYRRRINRFGDDPVHQPPTPPSAADEDAEALEAVYERIRALPPLDRSLILLHLDGLSYAQIAEVHGLTENAIGSRLTRLRTKIANELAHYRHELR